MSAPAPRPTDRAPASGCLDQAGRWGALFAATVAIWAALDPSTRSTGGLGYAWFLAQTFRYEIAAGGALVAAWMAAGYAARRGVTLWRAPRHRQSWSTRLARWGVLGVAFLASSSVLVPDLSEILQARGSYTVRFLDQDYAMESLRDAYSAQRDGRLREARGQYQAYADEHGVTFLDRHLRRLHFSIDYADAVSRRLGRQSPSTRASRTDVTLALEADAILPRERPTRDWIGRVADRLEEARPFARAFWDACDAGRVPAPMLRTRGWYLFEPQVLSAAQRDPAMLCAIALSQPAAAFEATTWASWEGDALLRAAGR